MQEVFTGQYRVYDGRDIFAKVSQCLGVGTVSKRNGLAHLHLNTSLGVLDEMFERTFDTGEIYLCGGVDAFVPQMGLIRGSRNADRVFEYLSKNGLEKYVKNSDVYTDYVRVINVGQNGCEIKRI